MKRKAFVLLTVFLAVCVPTALVLGLDDTSELLGKPAPNAKFTLIDGKTVELASHKDKDVVVLDFWATWCPPCRMSMPVVTELVKKYSSDNKKSGDGKAGVVLYGINQGEQAEAIKAYLQATGLSLTAVLDTERAIGETFGVRGYPTMVIVGKDGSVQSVHPGVAPDFRERLEKELDTLVSGKNLVEPKKAQ